MQPPDNPADDLILCYQRLFMHEKYDAFRGR